MVVVVVTMLDVQYTLRPETVSLQQYPSVTDMDVLVVEVALYASLNALKVPAGTVTDSIPVTEPTFVRSTVYETGVDCPLHE